MKLLIVEDNAAFGDFLRLWIAEQAHGAVPDVFEAATLTDALKILREEEIDGVLSDGTFPPDWGDRMGDPHGWRDNWMALRAECDALEAPFVLLRGDFLGKLSMASSAIARVLALASAHLMASSE